jgi:Kinesin motor domain
MVEKLTSSANENRQTGQTGANAESSRSHSIMQFALKKRSPEGKDVDPASLREVRLVACFSAASFQHVDLVGWLARSHMCGRLVRATSMEELLPELSCMTSGQQQLQS